MNDPATCKHENVYTWATGEKMCLSCNTKFPNEAPPTNKPAPTNQPWPDDPGALPYYKQEGKVRHYHHWGYQSKDEDTTTFKCLRCGDFDTIQTR